MTEKPRLNSREVECLVRLHKGGQHAVLPARLKSARNSLVWRELVAWCETRYDLTLDGKKIARHLTGLT